jgi:hypothetical protein
MFVKPFCDEESRRGRWVGPVTRPRISENRAKLLLKKETRRDVFDDPDIGGKINFTTNLTYRG